MNFEQNLFISYAHLDDQPLTSGEKGWITRFHATLKAFLDMRLGREATIWRDGKLRGNDVFSDEIVARFKQSAALVSIVTPRYLNSEWCTREAREFCRSAEQTGGLRVGNKSRVFKVIKTPVDPSEESESLPALMKDIIGFKFFTDEDGAPIEYDPDYGQKYAEGYKRLVNSLAWDIAELLKTLQRAPKDDVGPGVPPDPPAPDKPKKPAVYLAECSYDRKQEREVVEAELKRLGYPVLPDKRLPQDEAEFVATVQSLLERSALSVHLVGEKYGAVPDGPTGKSTGIIQNELAAARCKTGDLKRLIWLPEGIRSEQTLQQAFIDALRQDAQAQFGADLLAGGIEELRANIQDVLKKIEQPEPKLLPDTNPLKLLYVICNDKDPTEATAPVRKWCRQQGFAVSLPAFKGEDAAQIRKANQDLLANCDAALVFYGAGDEAWKRTVDSDLRKMAGYRGGRPLPAVYTYLAAPTTSDKEDLVAMEEAGLINGLSGFTDSAVAQVIQPPLVVGAAP